MLFLVRLRPINPGEIRQKWEVMENLDGNEKSWMAGTKLGANECI